MNLLTNRYVDKQSVSTNLHYRFCVKDKHLIDYMIQVFNVNRIRYVDLETLNCLAPFILCDGVGR